MNCLVVLKNGDTVQVENFLCVEAPKSTGEIKTFEKGDLESLQIVDSLTYTIIGGTILKIKGEQILYLHFK
ncbi:hypothetical protein ACFDA3_11455 [Staphylococcus epidermidis]|uniref:hypothetical protein n=1 Tax=Staphylococcus epidermidis TaxID=1282 RepID=UPI002DBCB2D8|nr:hypothetical protein [Staphylococcus epidermidis]MEB7692145.1 hypothetical protein [Staphylococcus epidermidis]